MLFGSFFSSLFMGIELYIIYSGNPGNILLNNSHTVNITEQSPNCFSFTFIIFRFLFYSFSLSIFMLQLFKCLPILRLYVELKDQYLTSLGSVALHINVSQINPHLHLFKNTPITVDVLRGSLKKQESEKGEVQRN